MVVSDEEEGPAGQGVVLSRRRLLYLSAAALVGGASVALLPRGPEPSPRWEAAPGGPAGMAGPRVAVRHPVSRAVNA